MKIIALVLLALTSLSVAQAKVYKCPGKTPGQFVYQESLCKGAKPDEHTVKIVPFDQRKIDEAQANLAKETEELKAKEAGTQPPSLAVPEQPTSPNGSGQIMPQPPAPPPPKTTPPVAPPKTTPPPVPVPPTPVPEKSSGG
jgi:hypothetical protein